MFVRQLGFLLMLPLLFFSDESREKERKSTDDTLLEISNDLSLLLIFLLFSNVITNHGLPLRRVFLLENLEWFSTAPDQVPLFQKVTLGLRQVGWYLLIALTIHSMSKNTTIYLQYLY